MQCHRPYSIIKVHLRPKLPLPIGRYGQENMSGVIKPDPAGTTSHLEAAPGVGEGHAIVVQQDGPQPTSGLTPGDVDQVDDTASIETSSGALSRFSVGGLSVCAQVSPTCYNHLMPREGRY